MTGNEFLNIKRNRLNVGNFQNRLTDGSVETFMTFKWLDDVKLDYFMRYVISLGECGRECVYAASVRAPVWHFHRQNKLMWLQTTPVCV